MFKLLKKALDKCYVKQWNIGLARYDVKDIIESKGLNTNWHWLTNTNTTRFFADPFVTKGPDNTVHVIYEDFKYEDQYGKISVTILDEDFNEVRTQNLLDTKSHLSYPYIFHRDGKTFVMPENSKDGELCYFEYDFTTASLINKETVFRRLPLLDSTILYHDGKFWLFATKRGPNSNDELFIYHAPHWSGPYTEHQANPVKKTPIGTRPAGDFIKYKGEVYRPTQNCGPYYGKSVILNRITKLTESTFEEEPFFELKPPCRSKYNFAIHTINFSDDVIVIDGLRRIFAPMEQVKIFLRKSFKVSGAINVFIQSLMVDENLLPVICTV